VPINATYQSCVILLGGYKLSFKTCDTGDGTDGMGPTVEETSLPFFGVDPASAYDEEGYQICPENITEVQCYGKIVRTPEDGRDVNESTAFSR
jgi:hypothetical protein